MSDEDLRVALLDLTRGQGLLVGRLDGFREHFDKRMHSLEGDIAAIREAQQKHGTSIATIMTTCQVREQHCARGIDAIVSDVERIDADVTSLRSRAKRHSEEVASLGGSLVAIEETTGQHHIEELTRAAEEQGQRVATARLLRAAWTAARILLALLATLGVGGGLVSAIEQFTK